MLWLWYRWRANYIWLVNRVFMYVPTLPFRSFAAQGMLTLPFRPGFLNSLAGVLSTLSSVLGTQHATLSISSKSTIIVTSAIAGVCGILTAFYMFVLIRNIKKQHDREVGKQRAGKHGEGFADLTKRKIGV
jgi:pilus assembly protein TadC